MAVNFIILSQKDLNYNPTPKRITATVVNVFYKLEATHESVKNPNMPVSNVLLEKSKALL